MGGNVRGFPRHVRVVPFTFLILEVFEAPRRRRRSIDTARNTNRLCNTGEYTLRSLICSSSFGEV